MMGGVFSSPDTPEPVDTAAIAAAEAEKERQKILERQRRGMEGTVKTSYQGILQESNNDLVRKKLLGE